MSKCELCGEPMPAGEEVFKFHGYSGPCPKPSQILKSQVIAEYIFRDMTNGDFWIDIKMNRELYGTIGPFDTEGERQRAHDDLLDMTRSLGAVDIPDRPQ